MKESFKLHNPIPGELEFQPSEARELELRLAPPGEQWLPFVYPSSSAFITPRKRTFPTLVVGWPPIRSFRKKIANCNYLKSPACDVESYRRESDSMETPSFDRKRMFRKINMDGSPIGRKVDLGACDTYEELVASVYALFGELFPARKDSSEEEKEVARKGLLDGSGDYNLVYEDNEGDRILVGDVPWAMFVSTVKRLRVLKSCDMSTLRACE